MGNKIDLYDYMKSSEDERKKIASKIYPGDKITIGGSSEDFIFTGFDQHGEMMYTTEENYELIQKRASRSIISPNIMKGIRVALGFSQREMGDSLGISQTGVNHLEKRNMSILNLVEKCNEIGVNPMISVTVENGKEVVWDCTRGIIWIDGEKMEKDA